MGWSAGECTTRINDINILPRQTKRIFVRVCPRDKQGNFKRTKPALYPIILANVELGTTVGACTFM